MTNQNKEDIFLLNYWKCPNCEDVQTFTGLCRDCTVYGESQNIIEPVRRIKVDKNGNKIISTPKRFESQNMAQLKQHFINQRSKKPTKKQLAKMEKEKELLKELESIKEKPNQEGIIEIGESALEEE